MESVLILCGRSEILICSFADETQDSWGFRHAKGNIDSSGKHKHISDPITGGDDEAASNHMKERCEAVATTQ